MKTFLWILFVVILIGSVFAVAGWSHLINTMLPTDSRPGKISFPVERIAPARYANLSTVVTQAYGQEFPHIEYFREAGVEGYRGPQTCLTCHETIEYSDAHTGEPQVRNLMDNLTTSVHYRFFSRRHPNVYGFNGELADNFPMGKINRPCPKPGSFAMTAWASFVVLDNGDTLSEGCGQCHIGGQYAPPLGEMMPGYRTLPIEKEAIDCLICHSPAYDMNKKQVVEDPNGRRRWDQDRSIRAAVTVTRPTAQACLRCHQHNFGGDIYIDSLYTDYHQSLINTGYSRPRVLHPGSKRGTPYNPTWDVHAAAGMDCIDCHITEGHHVAKGTHTTTMMANDLPEIEVACENCHDPAHRPGVTDHAEFLNSHTEMIACQTCHIPALHEDNVTRRDFGKTEYEEHFGIWIYADEEKHHQPGTGIMYVWWNGDASFLGNPIGDNPNGGTGYSFYRPEHLWPEFADFDYPAWYEDVMRPVARQGRESKLYAMKRFNGRQHVDLQNIGPFGGMYVPYNLPTYYTTGDPDQAAAAEMKHSMMDMMYGFMFKVYMLDKFMSFMEIDGWNTTAYKDVKNLRHVEPRWIPQDASLEISHAIRRDGALTCRDCHSPEGILDYAGLGYSSDKAEALREPRQY